MENQILNIAYIEYLNTREELNYFKDLITKTNKNITHKINLYLISNLATNEDIEELKNNVNEIFTYNSFNASIFDNLACKIQLGIVPSILAETISQATIEFISRNIPVLCGDKGGDSELCTSNLFTFNTEDINDFESKISNFINQPELLNEYRQNKHELTDTFINDSLLLAAE